MLRTLRERREQDEEGFTLIELMVVVLIIAILMAIAIPTFLGARGTANNRAAQSALRNALTAEKTYFTANSGVYLASSNAANIATLVGVEPAIGWASALPATTNQNVVIASIPTASNSGTPFSDAVLLQVKAATGDCYMIFDETSNTATTYVAGTSYYRNVGCVTATIPTVGPLSTATLTANTSAGTGWATSF
jgi:type IV pilus assembly protein PilA